MSTLEECVGRRMAVQRAEWRLRADRSWLVSNMRITGWQCALSFLISMSAPDLLRAVQRVFITRPVEQAVMLMFRSLITGQREVTVSTITPSFSIHVRSRYICLLGQSCYLTEVKWVCALQPELCRIIWSSSWQICLQFISLPNLRAHTRLQSHTLTSSYYVCWNLVALDT